MIERVSRREKLCMLRYIVRQSTETSLLGSRFSRLVSSVGERLRRQRPKESYGFFVVRIESQHAMQHTAGLG